MKPHLHVSHVAPGRRGDDEEDIKKKNTGEEKKKKEEREERDDACRKGRLRALRGPSGSQRVERRMEKRRRKGKGRREERSSDVRTGHNSRIIRRFIRAYVSEP